jgi:hypothetical protein
LFKKEKVCFVQDGVAIAAKVFTGLGVSYEGLKEVAALKAAKKEVEAGKKEEGSMKETKTTYTR